MNTRTNSNTLLATMLVAMTLTAPGLAQVEVFPERPLPYRTLRIAPLPQEGESPYVLSNVSWGVPPEHGEPLHGFCAPWGGWEFPGGCTTYDYTELELEPGLWQIWNVNGELVHEFEVGAWFQRGDANTDSMVDLSDAIAILESLFLGEEALLCLDAADADDSHTVDISDAISLLGYLFLGTAPPPPPLGECYYDAPDSLTCEAYPTICECPVSKMDWVHIDNAPAGISATFDDSLLWLSFLRAALPCEGL